MAPRPGQTQPHPSRLRGTLISAAALLVAVAVAGCSDSSNDDLSGQYKSGTTQNYVSGDGAVTQVPPAGRTDPISFDVTASDGSRFSSDGLVGTVVVINFWYASCPPCRAEAKHLNAVNDRFQDQDVQFIGVNVRDQQSTAEAFERRFNVRYPSVIDANEGRMQLALSGQVAPNAVPTTIVLDTKGRVAARVLGAIDGPGTLSALVTDELGT
ncbi:thiol-disulfide isomerase/thioredoxin [Curtobacterium flaccumfaciens]|uniref:Thiol-disulfide isomerase/thioredoxin n=1 Tax=Curtobacterium flaccumfaciens TaxID=2035 RepID=A0A4R6DI38_9MICO|nr:TlpA disulfide reductase family protein [Curtobacterium flaccumfaciens]TDN44391.1 thiol-disulfide isomerase/thioredoxin [Curtobacterium flaccumfaciens]